MIVKHVPMRSLGKSDFAGLVNYVTDTQSKEHRLGQVRMTNCHADSLRDAITEVLATQRLNTRAKGDKTYHLIVSFRAGEHPNNGTLKAIEERICAGLGYGEHQRISAVHDDTDNLHIHIAINKIHPVRHTMHEPYYPYRALADLCATMERDYGLTPDNHEPRLTGAENRAADMEHHAGVESLLSWIKRECLAEIKAAKSWPELHHILRNNGLALKQRGNGLVFIAPDGEMVKASTVARDLSKPNLEGRLGPFQPVADQQSTAPSRRYQKRPVRTRIDTTKLYARYQTEQRHLTAARSGALAEMRQRKRLAIEDAKRASRTRRAFIKVAGGKGLSKKLLYAQAFAALKKDMAAIHRSFADERERLYGGFKRRTWADWLKQEAIQGNAQALAALRARKASGLAGNTIHADGQPTGGAIFDRDNLTKKGAIIYRAGRSAVRDDGHCLQVSREATGAGVQAALRLAMARYGTRIAVNGSAQFKAQVIYAAVVARLPVSFSDPDLERRRIELLTKEIGNDRSNNAGGQPADRRSAGNNGRADIGQRRSGRNPNRTDGQPNFGRVGRVPPPQSQNRLRGMSELGVVCLASGSEMLLPRDVRHRVEQPRGQPDNPLRWGAVGQRISNEQIAAMDKYIAEREEKRKTGINIQKHSRYTKGDGVLAFAGIRRVDGQPLALLKHAEVVMVLPIDEPMAQRLRRVAIGDSVSVTPEGLIKASKGRSR